MCSGTMDFSCESLQTYQYLSDQELSKHIVNEFNYLVSILDKAKRSVLTKSETVQRIYCLACVLWQSQDTRDLVSLLTEDVFDALLQWTLNLPPNSDYSLTKVAVDRVLCSMCSIKPAYYDRLLMRLGIVPGNQGCENVYTFRHVIPDPEGESSVPSSVPVDLESVKLTENILKSLSIISLSYISTYKLIHSRFLSILIDLVVDFIVRDKNSISKAVPLGSSAVSSTDFGENEIGPLPEFILTNYDPLSSYPMAETSYHPLTFFPVDEEESSVSQSDDQDLPSSTTDSVPHSHTINVDLVTAILDFFAELCWQNILRTWLSSQRNTILWNFLIGYLCIDVPQSQKIPKYTLPSKLNAKSIRKLEEATINFFSKCCCGHFQNQEKLAQKFHFVLNGEIDKRKNLFVMSDFTRRIFLEFITSPGHIYVSIESGLQKSINKMKTAEISLLLPPPAFPTSKKHQLLYLNVDRTCLDILKKVTTVETVDKKEALDEVPCNNNESVSETSWENCLPSTSKQCEQIENFVLNTSKRFMDCDSIPQAKKICTAQNGHSFCKLMFWAPKMNQYINVNQHWTIAEILQIFVPSGDELEIPVLTFLLSEQDLIEDNFESKNLSPPPALQKFVALKGVELLTTYAEKKSLSSARKLNCGLRSTRRGRSCMLSQISIHTLLAFGQFLRLPEYRNNSDTKTVLQSIIGLGKEVHFNYDKHSHFFSQDVRKMCNPLMVLPFELLRLTLSKNYQTCLNSPELGIKFAAAIDFVLIYLSVYTHQQENKDLDAFQENKIYMEAIQQCYISKKLNRTKSASRSYWPKGTGYSSSSSSDHSKTSLEFLRIEEEEELVSSLLSVLGNYICPHPNVRSSAFMNYKEDICNMLYMHHLPSSVVIQIEKSHLIPVIMSYLKNDSVLDMVNHVPLYKAIMFVIRTLVSNEQLNSLILTASGSLSVNPSTSGTSEPESVVTLLTKLRTQIDTYLCRTKVNNINASSTPAFFPDESDIQEQLLFADIRNTADIIERIQMKRLTEQQVCSIASPNLVAQTDIDVDMTDLTASPELQKDYVKMMTELQFGQWEMITAEENDPMRFKIPYHFQNLALQTMVTIPARMKRLAMEIGSLASSLPISNESAIFVRHDESRIDIIKALITGPAGTPYMNGCFEFDIFCPGNYPNEPIMVNFQTTGRRTVRFNPNLYSNGKVCLSLLGTWPGENWNPKTSSILQVLVSIQAMILISEPYFNEPGFEVNRGRKSGDIASKAYNDNLLSSTIRHAMINQISSPSPCFKKIIHTHFWLKRDEIKAQVQEWVRQCGGSCKGVLQAEATQLFNDLDKLTRPA